MLRLLVSVAFAKSMVHGDRQNDCSDDWHAVDTTSLMQTVPLRHRPPAVDLLKQTKQHEPTRKDATQLLVEVESLVQTLKSEQQDPIRQCRGGWQPGDGTGQDASEQSIGHQDSRDSCIAAVRAQCTDANGATYVVDTGECICETGQQQLDDAVAGKENCAFFAEGVDDVAINTATDALAGLVTNILDTLETEHEGAMQLVETVFGAIITARNVPSVQNADEVTSLGETAERLRAAADAAHAAVEECGSSLSTWQATQSSACSAWEGHFQSLSSCSDACPCTTDSERFFNSYLTWKDILADGGGEEIERLHTACQDATTEVDRRSGDAGQCSALEQAAALAESESALADHAYASAWALHNQSCDSLASAVEVYMSTESELTLELTQRNEERCILQQVQCFLGLIATASETGELLDDDNECTDDRTCEAFFHMTFPEVPASPECVECPGCRNFGGGDAVAYDHSHAQCSAQCYPNFPGNNFCNTGHYTRCLWDRGQWVNGGYWQIITEEPQNFVQFQISAPSGTNGYVKYSDDGEEWSTAAEIGSTQAWESGDIDVEWSWEVGAHRYWRYETTRRQPGNWMGNFQFFNTELAQVVRAEGGD